VDCPIVRPNKKGKIEVIKIVIIFEKFVFVVVWLIITIPFFVGKFEGENK